MHFGMQKQGLNTSVVHLLGGQLKQLPVYWSHFATSRVRAFQHINKPQLCNYDDIKFICAEAVDMKVNFIKTNIFIDKPRPSIYMPGFGRENPNSPGIYMSFNTRERLKEWLVSLRNILPNNIGIALDLNFNFTHGDLFFIEDIVQNVELAWLELDSENITTYEAARSRLSSRISTGENFTLLTHFIECCTNNLADFYGIDCQWLGLSKALCAADICNQYGSLVSPHNFNGHLSTHIAASFACLLNNFYVLEYDYDDVPWRDEIFNVSGRVKDGKFMFDQTVIGWGAEPIYSMLEKHAI